MALSFPSAAQMPGTTVHPKIQDILRETKTNFVIGHSKTSMVTPQKSMKQATLTQLAIEESSESGGSDKENHSVSLDSTGKDNEREEDDAPAQKKRRLPIPSSFRLNLHKAKGSLEGRPYPKGSANERDSLGSDSGITEPDLSDLGVDVDGFLTHIGNMI